MKKVLLSIIIVLSLALTACSSVKDTVVAKVGNDKITRSEFEFYLSSVKQQLEGTELSTDEDWQTKEIDGKKAIEVAKEQALDIAYNNISYIRIYEKMGYKFDSEAKKTIKETKDQIVSRYENNGGYKEFLKQNNITDKFIDFLCKSTYCSDTLMADYIKDNPVSNEDATEYFIKNTDKYSDYMRANHILFLTSDPETMAEYDAEKQAEVKKQAEEIYKKALLGEDFNSLVKQYSQDPGKETNPDGYVFKSGDMVPEFEECVKGLEINGIGFTKSSYGYHIIKRLEINTESVIDDIMKSAGTEKFDEFIKQKQEEYGISVTEEPDYFEE